MEDDSSYENGLDNLEATELRLGLPGSDDLLERTTPVKKRSLDETSNDLDGVGNQEIAPMPKAQAVGWPPVRSYRRNSFLGGKRDDNAGRIYVKVSMDGAPYLRKIDLKVYKGYKEFKEGIEDLFKCFSLGDLSGKQCNNGSDYVITYEDKDGDWMLVGDVPWGMFISSCKRLRIMKGPEARISWLLLNS